MQRPQAAENNSDDSSHDHTGRQDRKVRQEPLTLDEYERVEQHVVGPDSHKTRKLFEKAVCGHF